MNREIIGLIVSPVIGLLIIISRAVDGAFIEYDELIKSIRKFTRQINENNYIN